MSSFAFERGVEGRGACCRSRCHGIRRICTIGSRIFGSALEFIDVEREEPKLALDLGVVLGSRVGPT